jgi:hypothetical protein
MAANKKAIGPPMKVPCLVAKGAHKKPGMVQPGVVITIPPASLTLQPLDASGNPITLTSADSVNGTLTSDSSSFVIGPGADSTHYVATIPPNTALGTIVNLAGTLVGTIQSAAANLTASLQLTLQIPPSPVAVDMDIVLG